MRELTFHEIDMELAEQLPAREMMNASWGGNNTALAGNGSGVGNVNIVSGNQLQLAIASPFASNGNFAGAG